jgi:1,4-alpha-glucan branching enzyme
VTTATLQTTATTLPAATTPPPAAQTPAAPAPPPLAAAPSAGAASSAAPPARGTRIVHFVLVAPKATSVSVVGSFNDWDPTATPLHRTAAGGSWVVAVPLQAGRHQYAFIVDGVHWTADPVAAPAVEDDFGVPNSVVTVGEATT